MKTDPDRFFMSPHIPQDGYSRPFETTPAAVFEPK